MPGVSSGQQDEDEDVDEDEEAERDDEEEEDGNEVSRNTRPLRLRYQNQYERVTHRRHSEPPV